MNVVLVSLSLTLNNISTHNTGRLYKASSNKQNSIGKRQARRTLIQLRVTFNTLHDARILMNFYSVLISLHILLLVYINCQNFTVYSLKIQSR